MSKLCIPLNVKCDNCKEFKALYLLLDIDIKSNKTGVFAYAFSPEVKTMRVCRECKEKLTKRVK